LSSIITKRVKVFFGDRLVQDAPLSRYTTARVGGPSDGLVEIHSTKELVESYQFLRVENIPCKVIGGGSNILVSDVGYRGILLMNKSSEFHLEKAGTEVVLFSASGTNLNTLTRQVLLKGFSGLEWAVGIPGTLGGAVYGNAGANGSDIKTNLIGVELFAYPDGIVYWDCTQMEYGYRTSRLKKEEQDVIILKANLKGIVCTKDEIRFKMDEYTQQRKLSQPTGASLGSIFKNPESDYAGRLIESAGLKGTRVGGTEVSSKHANFFINYEGATAQDIYRLIRLTQNKVFDQFGITLETEIELLGTFKDGE
jgi:UDP-N-acetylmuramate dehydrogenase